MGNITFTLQIRKIKKMIILLDIKKKVLYKYENINNESRYII